MRRVRVVVCFGNMRLPIANNCEVPWDEMPGSERVRHCASCARNVYDLSAMREVEVRALLMLFAKERLCITYSTDDQGEILFLKEARRASLLQRLSAQAQLGAGVMALTLGASAGCGAAVTANTNSAQQVAAPSSGAAGSSAPTPPAPPPAPALPPVDTDGDGTPDADDKCPYEPGPREGGFGDSPGCPRAKGMMVPLRGQLEILDRIYFNFRDSKVKPIARPILDAVAAVLRAHPEIEQVEIAGFSTPDEPRAKLLSEQRARAVMGILIDASVDPARVSAIGYGSQKPAYSNDTRDQREINRRVEFIITKRAACPAPAENK